MPRRMMSTTAAGANFLVEVDSIFLVVNHEAFQLEGDRIKQESPASSLSVGR